MTVQCIADMLWADQFFYISFVVYSQTSIYVLLHIRTFDICTNFSERITPLAPELWPESIDQSNHFTCKSMKIHITIEVLFATIKYNHFWPIEYVNRGLTLYQIVKNQHVYDFFSICIYVNCKETFSNGKNFMDTIWCRISPFARTISYVWVHEPTMVCATIGCHYSNDIGI